MSHADTRSHQGIRRRGTSLHKSYRYLSPQRVGFLHRFDLKTGIDFAHTSLETGMVFGETTGVYEHICLNQKEKVICENEMFEF